MSGRLLHLFAWTRLLSTGQIADALIVLRAAKGDFAQRGYKTETIRIVTQPLENSSAANR